MFHDSTITKQYFLSYHKKILCSPSGVVANVMICGSVRSELEFLSCYNIHFQIYTLRKGK